GLSIDKPNTMNSYDGFGRPEANLFTTPYGPQNYQEVLEDITQDKTKPHFYEERHSYNRQDDPSTGTNGEWNLDMDGTRRLMWWEAMSGGVGGWFGFYEEGSFPFGGHPYPNSEQLKAHREFWVENNRFLLNLEVDSTFSNGYGLLTTDNKNYIVYKENTSNIQFRISNIDQILPIIALDTKLAYKELYLGELPVGNHDWELPYISDWVIAIGNFEQSQALHPSDTTINNNVSLDEFSFSQPNNKIILEWATESEKNLIRFEVEKSVIDDSLDWNTIGFLVSKGTNETGDAYSFTDQPDYKNNFSFYRLKMVFLDNSFTYSENIKVENTPTNFSLNQNYPNPFNSLTTIEFSLPYNSIVDLSIYNILGQKIISLVNEELETGYYSYNLDASKLSSGVYYYRLISRDHLRTKKMLYIK
ncbi:MAG: T9SS type A sorting domain-containing protein, partial [Ignavibacteriae bacterium]|nr:T9SS type A sorting domain-containing protein [Ignavibacteriota bacterium]